MAYRTGEFIEESFAMLSEDIYCAHAKDIMWTGDLQPCIKQCMNGTGLIDYETYLIQLSRMKYPRTLLIEHLQDDQYPAARKFVTDTAARLGVKIYG
jgi:L-ribulose-5-phosphate 3-epimerase UlaE